MSLYTWGEVKTIARLKRPAKNRAVKRPLLVLRLPKISYSHGRLRALFPEAHSIQLTLPCCHRPILSGHWKHFLFNKLRRFRFYFHLQQNWVKLDPSLPISCQLALCGRHVIQDSYFLLRLCFHYIPFSCLTSRIPVYSYHGKIITECHVHNLPPLTRIFSWSYVCVGIN